MVQNRIVLIIALIRNHRIRPNRLVLQKRILAIIILLLTRNIPMVNIGPQRNFTIIIIITRIT